ncbi:MAG: creatininase family protein [Lentisphaeria bacterium]|nr:creatininase family protein [Lentisphaeria bacterium]
MQWENLTTPQFHKAVEQCNGVGVIAIGVLEAHSSHMPIGTDMFEAHHVAVEAAKLESAIVFPQYPFGINHECYHLPGGVVFKRELVMSLLENVCDEMARNGLKKIVILSGHGGNRNFIPLFVQTLNERDVDYVVYYADIALMLEEELMEDKELGHACEAETSTSLHIFPEHLDMESHSGTAFRNLKRNEELKKHGVYSPMDWYAQYPTMTVGNGSLGTAEKGKIMVESRIKRFAEALNAIKEDHITEELKAEYLRLKNSPKLPNY